MTKTSDINPKYPLYIVSKGRYDSRYTAKYLEYINVPYFIIVEEQEYDLYGQYIDKQKILVLDKKFQDNYDTCDNLGYQISKGSGPARNYAWEHSIKQGYEWHWVMDDNIRSFIRLNENKKIKVSTGAIFKAMEDFILKYENIGMGGPQYKMFAAARQKLYPYAINTKVYSCNFIRNNLPFRWRGRYNEDLDLTLRILKSGLCTIQFFAFLQDKMRTQTMGGGNTDSIYKGNGILNKAKMIIKLHPDIVKMKYRYHRIHHMVDYSGFKQKLIKKQNAEQSSIEPNEYGMMLRELINA